LLATHKAIPGHFPGPIYGHNKLGKRLNHSGGQRRTRTGDPRLLGCHLSCLIRHVTKVIRHWLGHG